MSLPQGHPPPGARTPLTPGLATAGTSANTSAWKSPAFMSLVLGIGSLAFSFAFVGLVAGVAAIVLGVRARREELDAPRWVPLTGIFTGIGGIVFSLLWGAFVLFFAVILPLWAIGEVLPQLP